MRRLIYLVAVSADGFIADLEGGADAFAPRPETLERQFREYPETCPAHARDALGVTAIPRHFDTVVMGSRTHLPALEAGLASGYPHLRQLVVTHRRDLPAAPGLTFVHEDPVGAVRALKREQGRDIWLCGGSDLASQLAGEIDELHLKVHPFLLGDGLPLARRAPLTRMRLLGSEPLGAGMAAEPLRTTRPDPPDQPSTRSSPGPQCRTTSRAGTTRTQDERPAGACLHGVGQTRPRAPSRVRARRRSTCPGATRTRRPSSVEQAARCRSSAVPRPWPCQASSTSTNAVASPQPPASSAAIAPIRPGPLTTTR